MTLLRAGPRVHRRRRAWLSTRVGLAIGPSSLRAVGVRGGTVRWVIEGTLDAGEPLESALLAFLRTSPAAGQWPRPRVTLALPPGLAQVKRVGGLPQSNDSRLLTAVLRQSPGRFFLNYGGFLVTGGARIEAPGVAWAAAYDGQTVADVVEACRRAQMRLDAVLPTIVLLGLATTAERLVWAEGSSSVEVSFGSDRSVRQVRRFGQTGLTGDDALAPPAPVEQLARLGDRAWRFAGAYGAAVHTGAEPFEHRPGHGGREASGPVMRRRLMAAAGAALVGGTAAVAAPAFAAVRVRDQAEAELRAVARQHVRAVVAEQEVVHATATLRELIAFDSRSRSASTFLFALASVMPERSAIVAIKIDSMGGQIVVVAPSAAAVVGALERVSDIASPEITGPVTRESVTAAAPVPNMNYAAAAPPGTFAPRSVTPRDMSGSATTSEELERVAVRFRFRARTDLSDRGAAGPPRNSP